MSKKLQKRLENNLLKRCLYRNTLTLPENAKKTLGQKMTYAELCRRFLEKFENKVPQYKFESWKFNKIKAAKVKIRTKEKISFSIQ